MASKAYKKGDQVVISATVVKSEGGQVTLEINDGDPRNHHCVTLGVDQLEGKSVRAEPDDEEDNE